MTTPHGQVAGLLESVFREQPETYVRVHGVRVVIRRLVEGGRVVGLDVRYPHVSGRSFVCAYRAPEASGIVAALWAGWAAHLVDHVKRYGAMEA